MNTQEIKKLLKSIKPERIVISDHVRFKIENVHGVSWDEVLKNLREPSLLTHTEQQPSRWPHDETYGLLFELTKRRRMFVVTTYKTLENKIYIVTAYPSTKKVEKLIKKVRIRR